MYFRNQSPLNIDENERQNEKIKKKIVETGQ